MGRMIIFLMVVSIMVVTAATVGIAAVEEVKSAIDAFQLATAM